MASLTLFLLPFVFAVTADDVAPAPTPPQLNLTGLLDKAGQYTTLLRLLHATRIDEQLSRQLKNTYDGLTFFAPTENAFAKLRPGTLNGLSDQQQVQLLLYHVLPRFYSVATFQTASNPLRTEASGPGGVYTVNVTTSTASQLVNVSTGVAAVPICSTVLAEFPLAVFSVDDVLRPEQLFGGKVDKRAPAPAPAHAGAAVPAGKAKVRRKGVPKSVVAAEPTVAGDAAQAAGAGRRGSVGLGVVAALALMVVVNRVVA